jgi:deoxyribodipyrimidine photo-lyase
VAVLREGLRALDHELRAMGSSLVIRRGDPRKIVPDVARQAGADLVTWTGEVSPLGQRRDADVAAALQTQGIDVRPMPPDLHVQPDELMGSSGRGYLVFTPFWRNWSEMPVAPHIPAPTGLGGPSLASDGIDVLPPTPSPVPAGPAAARQAIVEFITSGAADRYGDARDELGRDGTSHLSTYLRFGMCTTAQIGRALGLPGALSPGRQAFWRQLCWREFYAHHLARTPQVATAALREDLRNIAWDNDPAHIEAWRAGRTGYPLVDAAMRQLAECGWVHNRARMVTASFLVKDLLVDWRIGETIFMQGLIDGDPTNNNGGWQWVAGTGTDAAPYFRVLNPVLQAKRFDPDGHYVRRYIPQLRDVPTKWIFEPWRMSAADQQAAGCVIGSDYPAPIVEHKTARVRALARYEAARRGT